MNCTIASKSGQFKSFAFIDHLLLPHIQWHHWLGTRTHAICQLDVRRVWDYNSDQSAKSLLPVSVVWLEQPQGLNRLNQPNLFLAPSAFPSFPPFLTYSLAASHPDLSSSHPLLIHPFHPSPLHYTLLLLFTKMITLHIRRTCISTEHALSSPMSPLILSMSFQELAKAMLFQIIQLLKLILS